VEYITLDGSDTPAPRQSFPFANGLGQSFFTCPEALQLKQILVSRLLEARWLSKSLREVVNECFFDVLDPSVFMSLSLRSVFSCDVEYSSLFKDFHELLMALIACFGL
jgi:hypothetical protein